VAGITTDEPVATTSMVVAAEAELDLEEAACITYQL
jgi:hypothetical protein